MEAFHEWRANRKDMSRLELCSTNRDVERAIQAGRFRVDLYYSIKRRSAQAAQMSERREEVPAWAKYFRTSNRSSSQKNAIRCGPEVLNYLREIALARQPSGRFLNCIAGMAHRQDAFALAGTHRNHEGIMGDPDGLDGLRPLRMVAKEAIRERERRVILEALQVNRWNRRRTVRPLRSVASANPTKSGCRACSSQKPGSVSERCECQSIPG